jgi:hypothetical protein
MRIEEKQLDEGIGEPFLSVDGLGSVRRFKVTLAHLQIEVMSSADLLEGSTLAQAWGL